MYSADSHFPIYKRDSSYFIILFWTVTEQPALSIKNPPRLNMRTSLSVRGYALLLFFAYLRYRNRSGIFAGGIQRGSAKSELDSMS